MLNKKVIIRSDHAGVFYGTLAEKNDNEVLMTNCRRLLHWEGAASLTELALQGTTKPFACMFSMYAPEMVVLGVAEIIPCSDEAIASIESVDPWVEPESEEEQV